MRFSVHNFGVDAFNVDGRCRQLNTGSYHSIPSAVREQAQKECQSFVEGHIRDRVSFATETTVRALPTA